MYKCILSILEIFVQYLYVFSQIEADLKKNISLGTRKNTQDRNYYD